MTGKRTLLRPGFNIVTVLLTVAAGLRYWMGPSGRDMSGTPFATCVDAAKLLTDRGVAARVVSLPCRELFWTQDANYKASVLPAGIPKVSVEAGVTLGWERYTGENAAHVGIDGFGHSAPANIIAEKLGFTGENIANVASKLIG